MTAKILIPALLSALLTLVACSGGEPEPPAAAPADLHTLLTSESRPAEDRARDAARKPADIVEFLGIETGMRVIDVIAAGGYYTEVLSLAVGPDGRVVAQNPQFVLEARDGVYEKTISSRLAGNRLPNVARANGGFDAISTAGGRFDAALTALNFHDLYNGRGPEVALASLQAIHGLLKPGGVLGVIDHVGVAGADNAALHRIEVSKAVATAEAAGFVVEARSKLLANTGDDHTQRVFAEAMHDATDRFILKLRKPAE